MARYRFRSLDSASGLPKTEQLNPDIEADQPQYFEAHGTGTQAGDPKEATAINRAFGLGYDHSLDGHRAEPLYVGSIKTIVGHLEGAAGLAGLLKASVSLQKGLIPANLHFNRLNPKLEPLCQQLRVPTSLTEWPKLLEGVPRRVSVNSFGTYQAVDPLPFDIYLVPQGGHPEPDPVSIERHL